MEMLAAWLGLFQPLFFRSCHRNHSAVFHLIYGASALVIGTSRSLFCATYPDYSAPVHVGSDSPGSRSLSQPKPTRSCSKRSRGCSRSKRSAS